MAIALDTSDYTVAEVDISEQITLSFAVASNTNRLILAAIYWDDGESISSVTYDGDALAEAVAFEEYYERNAALYYRVAPSTGTNNLVVTMTSGAGTPEISLVGISLYGVDQSSPIGATATGNVDNTTGITTNLTTTAADSWIVDALSGENNLDSAVVGANQVELVNYEDSILIASSYRVATSTAQYAMEWSWDELTAKEAVHVAAEIKEAAAATGIASMRQLTGVGQGTR